MLKRNLLAQLPSEWPAGLLPEIRRYLAISNRTLVVLDDDPTGTQTVANIPVLTEWSVGSLVQELSQQKAFYILTNSRSLPEAEAVALNKAIGQNLLAASAEAGRDFALVSRSDSTLRGHFPAEVGALTEVLPSAFDGCLLIPYFLEGGRLTVDDVHYVMEGERLIPAGQTPFAQDKTFGYTTSNLREWVAEKTGDRVPAGAVSSISLETIRQDGPDGVRAQLAQVSGGRMVVVNAVTMRDLEVFVLGLLQAEASGKRFIYRTAASFVQVRAGLAPPPLLTAEVLGLPERGGGLIVAGSYVPKTTAQIEALSAQTDVVAVEVAVEGLLDDASRPDEINRAITQTNQALSSEQNVLVYTSRQLVTHFGERIGLAIGQVVSASLVDIVKRLAVQPRFIVTKGGITSSDIATQALGVRRADIMGQTLPGVPVWRSGRESRYPSLPLIIFPGNVGDRDALVKLIEKL